jgi:hypothetical protein
VGVAAYALFFIAGLGFGYAAVGKWKWLPILFPLALALGAALQQGVDGTWVFLLDRRARRDGWRGPSRRLARLSW